MVGVSGEKMGLMVGASGENTGAEIDEVVGGVKVESIERLTVAKDSRPREGDSEVSVSGFEDPKTSGECQF